MPRFRRRRARDSEPVVYEGEETVAIAPPAATRVEEETYVDPPGPPAEGPPPERNLWPWLLALLLLVLGGLGAAFFLTRDDDDDAGTGPTTTATERAVPRVVGMRAPAAAAALRQAGFKTRSTRIANPRPTGVVVRQQPSAGARLQEGAFVVLFVSRGPPQVLVPDVVGLRVGAAFKRLEDAELKPVARRVNSAKPVGEVLTQTPAAGERIGREAEVELDVSKGPAGVTVPSLVTLTEAEAVARLEAAGLVGELQRQPSTEPEGTVIRQRPAAGAKVKKGATITYTVSFGGQTTPTTTTAGRVSVPDVVGLSSTQAVQRLDAAGLGSETVRVNSTRPADEVISQKPAAGARVAGGAVVTLNVSLGSGANTVPVPDVVGLDEEAARARLTEAGFTVRTIAQLTQDPTEAGTVLDQEPAAGTRLRRGGQVRIFVATLEE